MGLTMASDEQYKTAFTFENLAILEKAIVGGVSRVKYSDKEIEYRSIKDMVTVWNAMKAFLNPPAPSSKGGFFGGRRRVARHSKGLQEDGGTIRECFNGYGDNGDI